MIRAGLLLTLAVLLTGCNTAAGVSADVTATGAAITRSAQDIKHGW